MQAKRFAVLALALLLTGCGGAKQATNEPQDLNTENWTQHTGESGAFSLKIPDDWSVASENAGGMQLSRGNVSIVAKKEDARGESLAAHLSALQSLRASIVEGTVTVESQEETPVVIGDTQGVLRKEQLPLAGLSRISAYLVRNGSAFTFTIYSDDGSLPSPSDEALFHYLLSTVTFSS